MEDQEQAASRAVAVVSLPAELDATNASNAARELADAVASGAAVVIADMTGTSFCDSMGVRVLVLTHKQAVANGAEFRVVLPSPAVLRLISVLGLDEYLLMYPTLDDAMIIEPGTEEPSAEHLSQAAEILT